MEVEFENTNVHQINLSKKAPGQHFLGLICKGRKGLSATTSQQFRWKRWEHLAKMRLSGNLYISADVLFPVSITRNNQERVVKMCFKVLLCEKSPGETVLSAKETRC